MSVLAVFVESEVYFHWRQTADGEGMGFFTDGACDQNNMSEFACARASLFPCAAANGHTRSSMCIGI